MSKQTGQCLCGAVAYEIEGDFLMNGICHCKNCQRQAGSAFSIIAGVPKENFSLTRGMLKVFEDTADSGKKVQRKFCGDCGSPILSEIGDQPDSVYIKAGTLDDTSGLNPQFHVWCDSAQGWVDIPDGVAAMPRQ
jgi:hypothetical protein